MKRFASLIAVPAVVTACLFALAGGAAAESAASALPTLNLALTGKTGISVSGSEVSGAVNVVSTFTGKGQGQAALVRLNPALPRRRRSRRDSRQFRAITATSTP